MPAAFLKQKTDKTRYMQKTFTKAEMQEKQGCYKEDPGKLERLSFMQTEGDISIESIITSEVRLKDKYWFVTKRCGLTIHENQELAIGVAEIVLEIYEKKYPDNKAPREAIQAAKDYLAGAIGIEELRGKRSAAYAAYAAAAAADAAAAYAAAAAADAAAAYAADAAAADAAAAYAAYAAADAAAAYAAYAAADAAAFTIALQKYLEDFVATH